jgi:hypothetical protein
MIKTRARYSLFCKNHLQKGLIYACVYFPNIPIWKICQGKLYVDGRLRYINNGIEGIAKRFHYRGPEYSMPRLKKLVIDLNKKTLESLYLLPHRKKSISYVDYMDDDLPVVEIEDDDDLTIEDVAYLRNRAVQLRDRIRNP